jgi:hypothetical protein
MPDNNDNVEQPATQGPTTKMAAVKLPDRLSLGPTAPKNWKIFKQRWDTYSIITDLNTLPLQKQKAFFIHCLDDDALDAYNTFVLEDGATNKDMISAFDKFIVGESNETYERYCFNKRNQEEGECFELFYADLQRLIRTCNFCNDCQASLLKYRIVLGITDSSVQKDLLKIRRLTLEQTIDICKSSEQACSQNQTLRPDVNKIYRTKNKENQQLKNCKFCGNDHVWNKEKCPAFGKKCVKCEKLNHFASMCNFKKQSYI